MSISQTQTGQKKELDQAKKAAQEAIESKSQFLSAISHELRTPMGTINSIANLLLEQEASDELKNYFSILKRASDNMFELLDDLRDLNNTETGSGVSKRRNMDLAVLAQTVLLSASVQAEEKGLSTILEVDTKIPSSVTGNASTIRRVLAYLLGTAIKALDVGHISLELVAREMEQDKVEVEFIVTAQGDEYNEKDDNHFDGNSTDLGLTISQKLLDSYGSRVTVDSRNDVLTLKFSLELDHNAPLKVEPAQDGQQDGEPSIDDMRAKLASKNVRNMGVTQDEKPAFTIENYATLCANDESGLEELVKMSIQNLSVAREEFEKAFKGDDLKAYELSAHEIVMALKILQADRVLEALEAGRSHLESKGKDVEKGKKVAKEMKVALTDVIKGLENLLVTRFGGK